MKDYCQCSFAMIRRDQKTQVAYCFECKMEINELMKDTDKPDFEKMGEQFADRIDRRGTSYHEGLKVGFRNGCEKIWNEYVVQDRKQNIALSESYAKLQVRFGESESESIRLKSELDNAKELLSKTIGEIPELLLSEVCYFLQYESKKHENKS